MEIGKDGVDKPGAKETGNKENVEGRAEATPRRGMRL